MLHISEVKGAIFNVDDTLLDNKSGELGKGLHERSRYAAFQAIGAERGIALLSDITPQQNLDAFLNSPVHSLAGAVWNHLWLSGLVDTESLNPDNELLQAIVAVKNELHVSIIENEAEEVAGASDFLSQLAERGLGSKLAVASSAIRRDVDLFFTKMSFDKFFPDEHIITLESVTHLKPHPESFDLAFLALGLPESERRNVLAFEDDPRGIMSAQAAGLYVCGITTRFSRQQLEGLEFPPDCTADSYAEFGQLLDLK